MSDISRHCRSPHARPSQRSSISAAVTFAINYFFDAISRICVKATTSSDLGQFFERLDKRVQHHPIEDTLPIEEKFLLSAKMNAHRQEHFVLLIRFWDKRGLQTGLPFHGHCVLVEVLANVVK